ncbi:MAG: hypothetical protein AAGG02_03215, partial [Cyanobacteria bacterium P01_H01_bin.15]
YIPGLNSNPSESAPDNLTWRQHFSQNFDKICFAIACGYCLGVLWLLQRHFLLIETPLKAVSTEIEPTSLTDSPLTMPLSTANDTTSNQSLTATLPSEYYEPVLPPRELPDLPIAVLPTPPALPETLQISQSIKTQVKTVVPAQPAVAKSARPTPPPLPPASVANNPLPLPPVSDTSALPPPPPLPPLPTEVPAFSQPDLTVPTTSASALPSSASSPVPSKTRLVGLMAMSDEVVAIIEVNGQSEQFKAGQNVGPTGWQILSATPDQVTISRGNQTRSVSVGQDF